MIEPVVINELIIEGNVGRVNISRTAVITQNKANFSLVGGRLFVVAALIPSTNNPSYVATLQGHNLQDDGKAIIFDGVDVTCIVKSAASKARASVKDKKFMGDEGSLFALPRETTFKLCYIHSDAECFLNIKQWMLDAHAINIKLKNKSVIQVDSRKTNSVKARVENVNVTMDGASKVYFNHHVQAGVGTWCFVRQYIHVRFGRGETLRSALRKEREARHNARDKLHIQCSQG